MDFSQWFVAKLEGEANVCFLVKAVDKADAIARFLNVRRETPEPIITWQEYCEEMFIGDEQYELTHQLGWNWDELPLGTVTLIK